MGSHSVTCHTTEVRIPPLPPAEAGTRFSDPGGIQDWVGLWYVKATGRELNPRPVNRKSNALPLSHHATRCSSCLAIIHSAKGNTTQSTVPGLTFPHPPPDSRWKDVCASSPEPESDTRAIWDTNAATITTNVPFSYHLTRFLISKLDQFLSWRTFWHDLL